MQTHDAATSHANQHGLNFVNCRQLFSQSDPTFCEAQKLYNISALNYLSLWDDLSLTSPVSGPFKHIFMIFYNSTFTCTYKDAS